MQTRSVVAILLTPLAVVALVTVATADPPGLDLAGLLNGHEEVNAAGDPDQGDLDAAGYAVAHLDLDGGQVCVTEFNTAGVDGTIFLFHIHNAPAGQNGPVVVDFVPLLPSGIGCVDADQQLLQDIRRHPEDFYFNVHSMPNFPAGAIRGQVRNLGRH
jgi:hypothetical protein